MRLVDWLGPAMPERRITPVGRKLAGVRASVWTLSCILFARGASAVAVVFAPIGGITVGRDRLWLGLIAIAVSLAMLSRRWHVPDWFLQFAVLMHVASVCWYMATASSALAAEANLFALVGVAAYVGAWFTRIQAMLHLAAASLGVIVALGVQGSATDLVTVWVTALVTCYALAACLHIVMQHQAQMASVDLLTGVLSRVGLATIIDSPSTSSRLQQPLCLAVLDLDGFKAVNDAEGHEAGDRLLRLVGEHLREGTRQSDVVARLGGDEFLVILGGTRVTHAEEIIARLVEALPIGASYGIAEWPAGAAFDTVVHEADSAMYEQKLARRAI